MSEHDQDARARDPSIRAPRTYRYGTPRRIEGLPSALPEPVRAYLDILPPGRIVGFPLAPLDRTGVPVWFVSLFLDDPFFVGAMPSGIGYGATDDEALIGAVAEIAENLMPSLAVMPRKKERGSYDDLVRVFGAGAVADPLTLCLPAGSPVGRGTVLEWTPTIRARTGETVLMPLDIAATDYFEPVAKKHNPKLAANWITAELFGRLNKAGVEIDASPVTTEKLSGLLSLIEDGTLSGKMAKVVFDKMFEADKTAAQIVEEEGLRQVSDSGAIEKIIDDVIAGNPEKVAEYRSGKDKLFAFFIGQVMKNSGGKANPGMVNDLLKKKLAG